MRYLFALLMLLTPSAAFAQMPSIEPGVSQGLARWRAARYSNIRYKLNLTLEKMSPVLKGSIEVRVAVREAGNGGHGEAGDKSVPPAVAGGLTPIILDWRKIKGFEDRSTITSVTINGREGYIPPAEPIEHFRVKYVRVDEQEEHLIFRDGVVPGENVIKLDFTSPILTSGSAITRYVDKEDGSEYIYSLFVPSDASTAFPVFDQPDLKARFTLSVTAPTGWEVVSNTPFNPLANPLTVVKLPEKYSVTYAFPETKPISTYVFAFAAGPWEKVSEPPALAGGQKVGTGSTQPTTKGDSGTETVEGPANWPPAYAGGSAFVRKSQAAKFRPHAAEVFRLNREAVRYFEQYFDYKFPFPKYDLVLIPEFPFGGMEHAGATFLRESAIIFPQEPTKNDIVSRATLIFHEAAHQWFGDTVTMRWFDDLWLKEGFATFTAYKAMEKIMPEMNSWKVFYERIKQGAYQTDSTRGTTAIYQPIANLSAAKSAYGNIVYNKAPAFLRQAEFYLGEDKFQTAVRAFLKKHEFGNAGWEDLVREFEIASRQNLKDWANVWVRQPGLPVVKISEVSGFTGAGKNYGIYQQPYLNKNGNVNWIMRTKILTFAIQRDTSGSQVLRTVTEAVPDRNYGEDGRVYGELRWPGGSTEAEALIPNYGDYGYGIFLLDEKSRDYVLKNIENEKDPFLRSMMWGALWDSVREGELDPRVFVELVVKVLGSSSPAGGRTTPSAGQKTSGIHPSFSKEGSLMEEDESTVATLLGRVGTALNYYMSEPGAVVTGLRAVQDIKRPIATAPGSDKSGLRTRVEDMLIERMRNAPSLGQRITYYRAFLNIATSENARGVLKGLLATGGNLSGNERVSSPHVSKGSTQPMPNVEPSLAVGLLTLRAKDKFDIVTRLLILNDPDAPKLLADLEKTETSDDAKRYAYAAKAGIGTAENKAKYWKDFTENKEISESWIEAAFGPWNSIRHSELTLPYLQKALQELPNHKRNRKIFFVNSWLGAFIGGQRSEEALAIVNKFLADNPGLDNDLRLKILENVDLIERAVKIREKYSQNRLR